MALLAFKYLLLAALVLLVSALAKRSDQLGALLASLRLEQQPDSKSGNHGCHTCWYVLPTLLLFPWLLARLGFWPVLGASALLGMPLFAAFAWLLRPSRIRLP
ncbi:hypothetical protein ACFOLG_09765 [Vogesella facilis]|uniref:Uncharacterized protein n=1 Tax=Vogesella facilis TaxID=1655232 RepID=A0ABV7RE83_9NEIS